MAIHVLEVEDGVEVWSDCEAGTMRDGRCVGAGATRQVALANAFLELTSDQVELAEAMGIPTNKWPVMRALAQHEADREVAKAKTRRAIRVRQEE